MLLFANQVCESFAYYWNILGVMPNARANSVGYFSRSDKTTIIK